MTTWNFPTAFSSWGEEERDAINRVLKSGKFTMGEEVEAFESEFAAYHGKRHGIAVNSGSSANLIAIAALFAKQGRPLKRGDTALVPALAWSTTFAPLVQHGLNLILADCDATWNAPVLPRHNVLGMGANSPKIIIACSILGNPGYLAEWHMFADKNGAYLIEDNCESFGAFTPEGKLCGTYGLLSTFSFFYSHQISAIEGGMILTDDEELANLCRMLRAHGWTRDIAPPATFEEEYDFHAFGYNVRPLEMHAAIARAQLRKLPEMTRNRRHNAAVFRMAVHREDIPITIPIFRGVPNPFGLHFLCRTPDQRRQLVVALRGSGIDCRLPTGGSFRKHPYGAPWAAQETPRADEIHDRGLFLGNAPFDISEIIERTVGVMREALVERALA